MSQPFLSSEGRIGRAEWIGVYLWQKWMTCRFHRWEFGCCFGVVMDGLGLMDMVWFVFKFGTVGELSEFIHWLVIEEKTDGFKMYD